MSRTTTAAAIVCLMSIAGLAEAQLANLNQPNVAVAPDPRTLPKMVFEQTEHNFGTIFDDQKVTTRVAFVNQGPGTLEIRDWRGSCSCTVGSLHRDGEDPATPAGQKLPDGTLPTVTFQPGERGWLEVAYDPHNKTGMQTQTVTFVTNDPRDPNPSFRIGANVLPLVWVEPQVLNFNQVVKGQPATLDLYVTGRTEDFEVLAATISGNDSLTVEILETIYLVKNEDGIWVPEETPAGGGEVTEGDASAAATRKDAAEPAQPAGDHATPAGAAQPAADGAGASEGDGMEPIVPSPEGNERLRRSHLRVTLAGDATPGRLNASMSVRHNDPRREGTAVAIVGEVVGDVAVLPRQLAIGLQQADVPYERKIQVLSRSGVGFRIERVEEISNMPDDRKHNIQWEATAGGAEQGYVITVRGRAPASLAQIQGEFRIYTSLDSEAIITVPFFGHVQGSR